MTDFDLSRQIGPLPLGVWVLAIGGGLAVSYFVNRGGGRSTPAEQSDPLDGTGLVRSPANRGIFTFDDSTQHASGVSEPAPEPAELDEGLTDNYAWERAAIALHVGRGADGVVVTDAIGRFLTGEPVTLSMRALVAEAIRVLGPPPQPVPPIRNASEKDQANPSGQSGATAQRVRALYAQYGVPLSFGVRWAESPDARVARNVQEIETGGRTWADLEESLARLQRLQREGAS